MLETEQQRCYEEAYKAGQSEYGFPDRKISGERTLRDKRILVLGCGTGSDVWYLTQDNEVLGLDYANSGLEVAKRHGIEVSVGDLNECPLLPFEDCKFDIVVCKDILEHILDPLTVLVEARRVLRDDGYVVISVPNHFGFFLRMRILLGRGLIYRSLLHDHSQEYDEWNYMHIRFFTYAGFCRFLTAAGVKAEKWFWDFGNLAHYHQPDMWLEPQIWKKEHSLPLSRRGKIALSVIRPSWALFNVVFPRALRQWIVSLLPGLLCGGFYVRCVKNNAQNSRSSIS